MIHRHLVRNPRSGTGARWIYGLCGAVLILSISATPAGAQTSQDSTATLLWTAPGDDGSVGTASSYDVRYSATPIAGTDTLSWWNGATRATGLPLPSPAGSTDSVTVRGLSPTTTYYFIIRAADEVPNWSGFSNVAAKTTSGDLIAPGTIADLAVTGTTGTSISVRWTAPGDDGNTGTATAYDIRYSTSPITTSNWSSATQASGEPLPTAAGTSQSFTLTGLAGGRTYYIAMKANDERGNVSGLSNVASGTTRDVTPPAAVRDLSGL